MSRPLHRIALVSAALATVTACAPAQVPDAGYSSGAGRQCFTAAQLQNFRGSDAGPIYVRARGSDVFELTTAGCPGVNFANSLDIRPDGTSSLLCVGETVRLFPGNRRSAPVICEARVSRKLTSEQVAALPQRDQP